MKYTSYFLFLLIVLSMSMPLITYSHGDTFSYEETKEGYKIDIGHDEFIAKGESVRFDFAVYPENIEAIEGEVFTDVWVTLTKDKKAYFAGGVDKPVFGATGFTFVFPEEGVYTLSARFQNEGDTVVQTEFPLEIIPAIDEPKQLPPFVLNSIFAAGGLLLGFGIAFFIPRKNKIV